jgi:site-specific recombinase XerD
MVRTGLRQIECRTFPDAYVFDPERRKDLQPGQKIRLHLDPAAMEIKNSKPRDIDVPYDLMEKLWTYSVRRRQERANNTPKGQELPHLFLTEGGLPYSKDAIGAIFRALSKRVGFTVTAHMLRHSYATYLLWSLRKSTTFQGEPLLYVRDRLGHSDVSTTSIYLHLINSLEGQLVLAHEDEIDQLFASPAEPEPS